MYDWVEPERSSGKNSPEGIVVVARQLVVVSYAALERSERRVCLVRWDLVVVAGMVCGARLSFC